MGSPLAAAARTSDKILPSPPSPCAAQPSCAPVLPTNPALILAAAAALNAFVAPSTNITLVGTMFLGSIRDVLATAATSSTTDARHSSHSNPSSRSAMLSPPGVTCAHADHARLASSTCLYLSSAAYTSGGGGGSGKATASAVGLAVGGLAERGLAAVDGLEAAAVAGLDAGPLDVSIGKGLDASISLTILSASARFTATSSPASAPHAVAKGLASCGKSPATMASSMTPAAFPTPTAAASSPPADTSHARHSAVCGCASPRLFFANVAARRKHAAASPARFCRARRAPRLHSRSDTADAATLHARLSPALVAARIAAAPSAMDRS